VWNDREAPDDKNGDADVLLFCLMCLILDGLLSSYLRRLRGGVGWHVTGCTRLWRSSFARKIPSLAYVHLYPT
jgi:hypothetical protein